MFAAGDTFRAAAIEQLGIWAERTGAGLVAQAAGSDPAAVMFDAIAAARARGAEVVIADTAGRLQAQAHLMEELRKIKRVLQKADPTAPHEVLLVLDGNQGQNALAQAEQFHAAVGVTGLVITKLDGTARRRRRGRDCAALWHCRSATSASAKGPDDFGEFDAEAFARALVDGSAGRAYCAAVIEFEQVYKRYPNGREALTDVQPAHRARRNGVPDRPLRRGQELGTQVDRAAGASDAR